MDNNRKLSSVGAGVVMVVAFLSWMLSQMHGCDSKSLLIEFLMLLSFMIAVPAWVRKASALRSVILRCVAAIVLVIGLEMGYLTWLHSDYFPKWLLFPKPRIHHRAPVKPAAAQPWMFDVQCSLFNVSPFLHHAHAQPGGAGTKVEQECRGRFKMICGIGSCLPLPAGEGLRVRESASIVRSGLELARVSGGSMRSPSPGPPAGRGRITARASRIRRVPFVASG
jgi:hypothetical protein